MDALIQYALVKSSREVVFESCLQLKDNYTVIPPGSTMSIRDMQVHIAAVYQFWLLEVAQHKVMPYPKPSECLNVNDVRAVFAKVDLLVNDFCLLFQDSWTKEKPVHIPSKNLHTQLTPLTVFTHAITHEFHHKGQVMKMVRQLGITPPDTDVIRF
ncbi:MAG TPA: DinB family protein [Chitinophagaceae bacterium]|nr:DinB family protein [Chitinophagaceae bacterium]